jgi:DNA-binding response OmpR family regulator
MTILVVDDEAFLAELVQEILEAKGTRCILARNASEADSVLATEAVHGMVVDLHLPGRNGLDWLEEVALARPELVRRTLVITGSDLSPETYARTRRCGADLLPKPFRIEDLVDAVSRRLSAKDRPFPARYVPSRGGGGQVSEPAGTKSKGFSKPEK